LNRRPLGDEPARLGFEEALLQHDPVDLFDRAPCGYLSASPDGLIVAVNQTFLSWTGYTRPELIGNRYFQELLSPGGRIYYDTHVGPMLAMQGTVREIALELVRPDHGRIPVLVNAVMDFDGDGRPRVIRTAIFDSTERRAYERELLRAKETAEAAEQRAVALARTLQATLIPPRPPGIPGLDVGACYRPSGKGDEVGGDFYDVFEIADGDWAVVIGDVAGKGVEAAVITALARYTLRAAAVRTTLPSSALTILNQVLLAEHVERFCTAAFLRLRRHGPAWEIDMCSGGHLLPLLTRPAEATRPIGQPGSLLGVLTALTLTDVAVRLEPGDSLLLYTDGVTEARRGREFYGEHRLLSALEERRGVSASDLASGLVAEIVDFQAGIPRDDIAVVVIQVPGSRP
jgi:sigma-B regulation protein RsbU (phosphoserine phosphatase)